MSREISVAYARLRKQWPGLVVRQHQPRNKGWPDFVLIDECVAFVEVKWFIDYEQCPYVEPAQWAWLNKLAQHGALGLVLCGYDKQGSWFGLERCPGWVAWRAPLIREFTKRRVDRLAFPEPYWVGSHLNDLSEYIGFNTE